MKVSCIRMFVGGCVIAVMISPILMAAEETTEIRRVPVVVTSPQQQVFEQRIVTQGNIEAVHTAWVSPRVDGVLESIDVDEGDVVVAGETRLFATDAVKQEQNVIVQEHALAVARCGLQQAQAQQDRAQADLDKARLDYERFQRLLQQNATTQDAFEQQESRYKQVAAAFKVTQSQVALATQQVAQVEALLAIARKSLADTVVMAPISGIVSDRLKEPGENGKIGDPVLHIVSIDALEVSCYLPAEAYLRIASGKTPLRVNALGVDCGPQLVTYRAPMIHPKLRTFEIKALLENQATQIAPGAMAQVTAILDSREQWGVPSKAILKRGGQSVLFVIDAAGVAHQEEVQTGWEMDGMTEILSDNIDDDWSVVVMGQGQLDEGTAVSVQEGGK